jgi:signal transduction histidine kinase
VPWSPCFHDLQLHFVAGTDGTEFVNPAQPSLEGRNLMDLRDLEGKAVVHDEIAAAMKEGSA